MSINSIMLKSYYPKITTLFDLLQPYLVDIELLMKEDDDEYKKLLITSVVSTETTANFPQITKDKQELDNPDKGKLFDYVSVIFKNDGLVL